MATAPTGPFTGFSDETTIFFVGLEADNSRTYWQDHRELWERSVRAPMAALTAELAPDFGPAKVFRPHRDVRFSADKSPYKTQQGAVVQHPGGAGGWYVQVSADGLMVGGGMIQPARDQLARYRAAVDAERTGERLAAVVDQLTARGWTLMGDRLARAPRGVAPDHPRVELLRHKSIAARHDHGDPDWFTTRECLERVTAGWRELDPFLHWLGEHVGPAQP